MVLRLFLKIYYYVKQFCIVQVDFKFMPFKKYCSVNIEIGHHFESVKAVYPLTSMTEILHPKNCVKSFVNIYQDVQSLSRVHTNHNFVSFLLGEMTLFASLSHPNNAINSSNSAETSLQ